jgi:hypothetical protein
MTTPTPPRATRISPWQDNIRHMYEAGRDLETLSYWLNIHKNQLRRLIIDAGGKIRPRGRQRA